MPRTHLALLRAYATADSGQAVGGKNDSVSALKVLFNDLSEELGDSNVYGAARNAGHILAVEAAGSFVHCHLLGVAGSYFEEVLVAHIRCLFGHRSLSSGHISHFYLPP